MARTALFAAGVLSLLLVGTPGTALADSAQHRSGPQPGVFTLFGKTFCLAEAPPKTTCDFRAPEHPVEPAPPPANAKVVRFLGLSLCFGSVSREAECDLRIPVALPAHGERRASLTPRAHGASM